MRNILRILAVSAAAALASCDQAPGASIDQAWTKLGNVADGSGGATVFKRTDPDNGNTIYVAVGVNTCSVSVIPKK